MNEINQMFIFSPCVKYLHSKKSSFYFAHKKGYFQSKRNIHLQPSLCPLTPDGCWLLLSLCEFKVFESN